MVPCEKVRVPSTAEKGGEFEWRPTRRLIPSLALCRRAKMKRLLKKAHCVAMEMIPRIKRGAEMEHGRRWRNRGLTVSVIEAGQQLWPLLYRSITAAGKVPPAKVWLSVQVLPVWQAIGDLHVVGRDHAGLDVTSRSRRAGRIDGCRICVPRFEEGAADGSASGATLCFFAGIPRSAAGQVPRNWAPEVDIVHHHGC